jgi:hypothetical protein
MPTFASAVSKPPLRVVVMAADDALHHETATLQSPQHLAGRDLR